MSLPSPGSHWNVSFPAPRKCSVTALVAVDEIVSVAADQEVIAGAAEDRVIAAAAINRERELPCGERCRIDGVIAAERVDVKQVVGAFGAGERDLLRQSRHADRAAGSNDRDLVAGRRSVDGDAVRRAVTNAAAGGRRQIDGDLLHAGRCSGR